MLQICSVCKVVYGEKEPLDDQRLTHGYCPECYKAVMAEIDDTPNLTAIAAESSGVSRIERQTPNNGLPIEIKRLTVGYGNSRRVTYQAN